MAKKGQLMIEVGADFAKAVQDLRDYVKRAESEEIELNLKLNYKDIVTELTNIRGEIKGLKKFLGEDLNVGINFGKSEKDLKTTINSFDTLLNTLNSVFKISEKTGKAFVDFGFDENSISGFKELTDIFSMMSESIDEVSRNLSQLLKHFGQFSDVGDLQRKLLDDENAVANLNKLLLDNSKLAKQYVGRKNKQTNTVTPYFETKGAMKTGTMLDKVLKGQEFEIYDWQINAKSISQFIDQCALAAGAVDDLDNEIKLTADSSTTYFKFLDDIRRRLASLDDSKPFASIIDSLDFSDATKQILKTFDQLRQAETKLSESQRAVSQARKENQAATPMTTLDPSSVEALVEGLKRVGAISVNVQQELENTNKTDFLEQPSETVNKFLNALSSIVQKLEMVLELLIHIGNVDIGNIDDYGKNFAGVLKNYKDIRSQFNTLNKKNNNVDLIKLTEQDKKSIEQYRKAYQQIIDSNVGVYNTGYVKNEDGTEELRRFTVVAANPAKSREIAKLNPVLQSLVNDKEFSEKRFNEAIATLPSGRNYLKAQGLVVNSYKDINGQLKYVVSNSEKVTANISGLDVALKGVVDKLDFISKLFATIAKEKFSIDLSVFDKLDDSLKTDIETNTKPKDVISSLIDQEMDLRNEIQSTISALKEQGEVLDRIEGVNSKLPASQVNLKTVNTTVSDYLNVKNNKNATRLDKDLALLNLQKVINKANDNKKTKEKISNMLQAAKSDNKTRYNEAKIDLTEENLKKATRYVAEQQMKLEQSIDSNTKLLTEKNAKLKEIERQTKSEHERRKLNEQISNRYSDFGEDEKFKASSSSKIAIINELIEAEEKLGSMEEELTSSLAKFRKEQEKVNTELKETGGGLNKQKELSAQLHQNLDPLNEIGNLPKQTLGKWIAKASKNDLNDLGNKYVYDTLVREAQKREMKTTIKNNPLIMDDETYASVHKSITGLLKDTDKSIKRIEYLTKRSKQLELFIKSDEQILDQVQKERSSISLDSNVAEEIKDFDGLDAVIKKEDKLLDNTKKVTFAIGEFESATKEMDNNISSYGFMEIAEEEEIQNLEKEKKRLEQIQEEARNLRDVLESAFGIESLEKFMSQLSEMAESLKGVSEILKTAFTTDEARNEVIKLSDAISTLVQELRNSNVNLEFKFNNSKSSRSKNLYDEADLRREQQTLKFEKLSDYRNELENRIKELNPKSSQSLGQMLLYLFKSQNIMGVKSPGDAFDLAGQYSQAALDEQFKKSMSGANSSLSKYIKSLIKGAQSKNLNIDDIVGKYEEELATKTLPKVQEEEKKVVDTTEKVTENFKNLFGTAEIDLEPIITKLNEINESLNKIDESLKSVDFSKLISSADLTGKFSVELGELSSLFEKQSKDLQDSYLTAINVIRDNASNLTIELKSIGEALGQTLSKQTHDMKELETIAEKTALKVKNTIPVGGNAKLTPSSQSKLLTQITEYVNKYAGMDEEYLSPFMALKNRISKTLPSNVTNSMIAEWVEDFEKLKRSALEAGVTVKKVSVEDFNDLLSKIEKFKSSSVWSDDIQAKFDKLHNVKNYAKGFEEAKELNDVLEQRTEILKKNEAAEKEAAIAQQKQLEKEIEERQRQEKLLQSQITKIESNKNKPFWDYNLDLKLEEAYSALNSGDIEKAKESIRELNEEVLLSEQLFNEASEKNENVATQYQNLSKSISSYLKLMERRVQGETSTDAELKFILELESAWEKARQAKALYMIDSGGSQKSVAKAHDAENSFILKMGNDISDLINANLKTVTAISLDESYTKSVREEASSIISALNQIRESGIQTSSSVSEVFKNIGRIKSLQALTKINDGKSGIANAQTLSKNISEYLAKYDGMSDDFVNKFKELKRLLSSEDISVEGVKKLSNAFANLKEEVIEAGQQIKLKSKEDIVASIKEMKDAFPAEHGIWNEVGKSFTETFNKIDEAVRNNQLKEASFLLSELSEEFKNAANGATEFNKSITKAYKGFNVSSLKALVDIQKTLDTGGILTESQKELRDNFKRAITRSSDYVINTKGSQSSIDEAELARSKAFDLNTGQYAETIRKAIQDSLKAVNDTKLLGSARSAFRDIANELDDLRFSGEATEETYISLFRVLARFDDLSVMRRSGDMRDATKDALNLANRMSNYLKEFDGLSKKFSNPIKSMISVITSAVENGEEITPVNVSQWEEAFNKYSIAAKEAGKETTSFFTKIKRSVAYQSAQFIGMYFSLYDIIRYARQFATTVTEVDSALTELRKVSNATDDVLAQSFQDSAVTAKELGSNLTDVINSTADWARLGYDVNAAEQLARVTTLYQNVGDNLSQESASESLVSTLQGFQLDVSEAESVVDKFNEVANNYAIDTSGIGEALQRSAASFNEANTDLSESIALIAGTNEVIQDPESVGNMWKTVSMRIRGATTELEEAGEETDGMVESTSKLRDIIKGMTGFDILEEDGKTFKSLYDIVVNVGKAYQDLDDIDQAALLEKLAGKNRSNALAAAFNNIDTIEKAYRSAEESAGSAQREQENYAKSVQFSLDRLSASAQKFAADFLSSDLVKGLVDIANGFVSGADYLIDSLGSIPSLLGAGGIGLLLKGTVFNSDFDLSSVFKQSQGFGQLSKLVSLVNSSGATLDLNKNKSLLDDMKAALQGVSVEAITTNASILKMSPSFEAVALASKGLTAEQTVQALAMQGLSKETVKETVINAGYAASEVEKAVASTTFITAAEAETIAVTRLSNAMTMLWAQTKVFIKTLVANPVFQGLAIFGTLAAGIALYSNAMITTIDELKKKSDESREKYEETAGEIENLNSELSTTKSRINELKAQGTLSIAEEAELKKLQLQNDELERQIQYKQKILDLQAEQSATDARNFFNETDPTVVGISEATTKTEQTSTGQVTTVVPGKVETKNLNILEQVDNKINKYEDLIDKMEKGVLSPSDQKTLDELTAEITADIDIIQEKKEALYNTDGELINKSDSGLVKIINTLIDKWVVLNGVESDYGEILDSILSKSSKLSVDDTIDLAIKKQERANKKLAKKMENGVGFDFTKFMESETFTRLSEDTQTAIADYQAELVDARRKGSDVTKRKFGNIDLDNRQGIEWNTKNLEKYAEQLDTLGIKADDVANSISTVLGSSAEFDGLEIAFSPILQTENGSELLGETTVFRYIYDLLDKVKQKKKKWTTEDLLELDNEGLISYGKYIHGLIADVGETAKQTAEVMHYSDSVSMAWNNISDAVEESSFMFTESNIESFFPGITQEAVEAGSTIQEVIKELNSSLGYKNYKEMKRQLVDSLSVDPSDTGLKEDWSRYLDTLSDQQIDVLYNIDEDTDTSGWSINDFKNYLEEIDGSEITIDATIDISGEKQRLENLATYLGESLSATGLSTKSTKDSEGNETLSGLQSIKDMYSELKGYDSSKLFETTANGIHLNREELRKLEQELEKENLKKVNQELYSATDSYNRAYQKLREIGDLYGKDDERYISQEKITNELNDQLETLRLQKAEYQALTSEYNKLVTAQNTTDEREGYENIGNEYDAIADLVARGWYGDEEVRAFVDLLTFKDVSTAGADEVLKRWNQLDDKIKGTKFTYKDFFTVDDSGNATSDGIFNMLDALDQLNDKWVTIDKNGVYSFDFDTEEAAKALNVSVSWLNKMEQAAIDAGFAVNMNDSAQAQKYLKDQIEETTNALKTMDGALLLDVDFETENFDTEIKKIQEYRQTIDEAYQNKEISLEVHDKELEYANQNMLLLLEYKHQLEEPAYMKLDVSDVEKEYGGFLKLLQKYQKATERRDDLKLLGGSPDEIRAARKEASAYLDSLSESSAWTKLSFGIDEKATKEEIKKMIENNEISVPIDIDETEALDKIVGATDSLQKVLNGDYRLSFEFTKDDDGNILGMIMNLQDQNGIRITFSAEETEGLKNLGEQINGLLKTFNEGNVDLDSGLVGNIIKAFNSLPSSVEEALNTTDSELQSHLNNLETSIRMGLELDSEDVDFILNFIGNLSPELLTHIGIDTTVLDKWLKKDHDTTGKVAYSPDASKINAFERKDHTATGKIVYKPDISYLKSINFNRTATVTYRNSGIPLKQTGKNFASAFGTACAKGKWGVPKRTNALVGELG